MKNQLFLPLYFLGIILAIFVVFTGSQEIILSNRLLPDFAPYILFVSLPHMVVIIVLGYLVPIKDRPSVGERIQTAGYLHTLIGFSATLSHVGADVFVMSEIMRPLGSALITSILGWFFGSEIASPSSRHTENTETRPGSLPSELGNFTEALGEAHKEYIATLKSCSEELRALVDMQKGVMAVTASSLREITESANNVKTAATRLVGEFHEFSAASNIIIKNAKLHASALEKAALETEKASQYLSKSRVLIAELEKLINYITRDRH